MPFGILVDRRRESQGALEHGEYDMSLKIRIGQPVGVFTEGDQLLMSPVQSIRLGRLLLSSTDVNHDVYGIVEVQVCGLWYPIEEICHFDPDYVEELESVALY